MRTTNVTPLPNTGGTWAAQWGVVTVLGATLGVLAGLVMTFPFGLLFLRVDYVGHDLIVEPLWLLQVGLGWIAFLAWVGLGWAQWQLLLRKLLPGTGWWISATASAGLLLIGVAVVLTTRWGVWFPRHGWDYNKAHQLGANLVLDPNALAIAAVGAGAGLGMGAILGIGQWLVLRTGGSGAIWWIPAVALPPAIVGAIWGLMANLVMLERGRPVGLAHEVHLLGWLVIVLLVIGWLGAQGAVVQSVVRHREDAVA